VANQNNTEGGRQFGGEGFDTLFGNLLNSMGMSGTRNASKMLKDMCITVELEYLKTMRGAIDNYIKILQSKAPISDSINPFDVLGVSANSTREEVESAYKAKAAKCHPDKGGSNSDMVKVNAAYEAICRVRGWH